MIKRNWYLIILFSLISVSLKAQEENSSNNSTTIIHKPVILNLKLAVDSSRSIDDRLGDNSVEVSMALVNGTIHKENYELEILSSDTIKGYFLKYAGLDTVEVVNYRGSTESKDNHNFLNTKDGEGIIVKTRFFIGSNDYEHTELIPYPDSRYFLFKDEKNKYWTTNSYMVLTTVNKDEINYYSLSGKRVNDHNLKVQLRSSMRSFRSSLIQQFEM